jgi:hypothetical protein
MQWSDLSYNLATGLGNWFEQRNLNETWAGENGEEGDQNCW